ncbi:MAG: nuclear transport factor 2 family protein [Pseudomonadaceae bacterium]|nr:nuclear transport factor 2 family protein [Pseudomonadaceae bacterium]
MTSADANSLTTFQATQQATHACEQLCYTYARCLDFFDHDALSELFTSDAELVLGEKTSKGRQAIVADIAALPRKPTRHVISNVFTDLIDPTTARGIAYVQRLSSNAGEIIQSAGHFEDQYQCVDGTWLFARRRLHWLNGS